jgi:hypothetical protein
VIIEAFEETRENLAMRKNYEETDRIFRHAVQRHLMRKQLERE